MPPEILQEPMKDTQTILEEIYQESKSEEGKDPGEGDPSEKPEGGKPEETQPEETQPDPEPKPGPDPEPEADPKGEPADPEGKEKDKEGKEPQLSAKFAALSRKHKEIRAKENILTEKESALKQRESKVDQQENFSKFELPKIREYLKSDPAALVRMLGMDPQEVYKIWTERAVSGQDTADPRILEIQESVKRLQEENNALRGSLQTTEAQKARQQLEQTVRSVIDENDFVFVLHAPNYAQVIASYAEKKYETEGMDEGESAEDFVLKACQEVENDLERRDKAIRADERYKKKQVVVDPIKANPTPKSHPKTMTNALNASPRGEEREPESDEDFLADMTKIVRESRKAS